MMRILLIDDEADPTDSLRRALICQGFAVDAVSDLSESLRLLDTFPYDLVLLEPALLGEDREGFFWRLRPPRFLGSVFIVSREADEGARLSGFARGVDDYIVKPFFLSEVIARVRRVHYRLMQNAASFHRANVLVSGDLLVDLVAGEVKKKDKVLYLRPKEYAILVYLMKRAGQIVTHQEIVQHVWSLDFDPQTGRVESHISRLRAKLGDASRAAPIETIPGRGYRLSSSIARP
jgi:DNA-binding response OmpR family regulator